MDRQVLTHSFPKRRSSDLKGRREVSVHELMKDVGGTNCLGLFRMASLPTRRSPPHASTAWLLAEAHVTRQCFAVILRDNYDQRSRDIRILSGVVRARRAITIRLVATSFRKSFES